MSSVELETAGQREVIMTVLTHLKKGEINQADRLLCRTVSVQRLGDRAGVQQQKAFG
jgi:hypothetical protein